MGRPIDGSTGRRDREAVSPTGVRDFGRHAACVNEIVHRRTPSIGVPEPVGSVGALKGAAADTTARTGARQEAVDGDGR